VDRSTVVKYDELSSRNYTVRRTRRGHDRPRNGARRFKSALVRVTPSVSGVIKANRKSSGRMRTCAL